MLAVDTALALAATINPSPVLARDDVSAGFNVTAGMPDSGLLRVNVLRIKRVLFGQCCDLLWHPSSLPSTVSEHPFLEMGNCLWNGQRYQLDIL